MAKNKTRSAVVVSTPTLDEAEALASEYRALKIAEQKVLNDRNAAVQEIDAAVQPELAKIKARTAEVQQGLHEWARGNPESFAKARSFEFCDAWVGFRTHPPQLALASRKGNWEGALECVKQFLPAFIREKPEIDKEALIQQHEEEAVAWGLEKSGLKVVQKESFFVKCDVEEVQAKEAL